jgi:hypothetical protein
MAESYGMLDVGIKDIIVRMACACQGKMKPL